MNRDVNQKLKIIVANAMDDVIRHNGNEVKPEHIILSLISDNNTRAVNILKTMNVDVTSLYNFIYEKSINTDITPRVIKVTKPPFSEDVKDIFNNVDSECELLNENKINTAHIFLAMLKKEGSIKNLLNKFGINYNEFKEKTIEMKMSGYDDTDETEDLKNKSALKNKNQKSKTPVLDNFCRDVTKAAENGEIDPVIGREKEIQRLSQILSRRKKNNPVLIGEAGVGKTSIVDGLAKLIFEGNAPRVLADKKIYSLNLASIVAGTKYRGQFEERMKAILEELKENKDIIIFMDELHTIVGAGNASGSLDASNIFKPALANGELQIIGATTLDEFRENIEKDGALTRRFQQVLVTQPTVEETIIILKNIRDKYENHHKVKYTDEAIVDCVKMSDRYITDRAMPDKAIDVLDEAGAATNVAQEKPPILKKLEDDKANILKEKLLVVNKQKYEEAAKLRDEERKIDEAIILAKREWDEKLNTKRTLVDSDDMAAVVSIMTGIPLNKISGQETKKLADMDKIIKKTIIGQDLAIDKVTQAIKRNRLGIKDKKKPIGSFIFLGPTGVGKTELAKQLAYNLFGDSDSLIRIDMSEYQEKHNISRMIGAPPGYVGYEQGGQLTEKVRRKPYCVILLDEIEKAHPDVFNLLLQLMDEGQLTDGLGRKIDFKNALIILTSNVGVKDLGLMGKSVGFKTNASNVMDAERSTSIIIKALKKKFNPEFLNRMDDIIIFNSLKPEDIHKIIYNEIDALKSRLTDIGIDIKLDKSVMEFLSTEGYDVEYGARPLARTIQNHIGNLIADEILNGNIKENSSIKISYDKINNKVFIK